MKCPVCKKYTLKDSCSHDKSKTLRAIPLKFSGKQIIGDTRRKKRKR